jgi:hypothetical protein
MATKLIKSGYLSDHGDILKEVEAWTWNRNNNVFNVFPWTKNGLEYHT